MDQAVEHGVGVGGVANQRVPLINRGLAGDDGGAAAVAVLRKYNSIVEPLIRCSGCKLGSLLIQIHNLVHHVVWQQWLVRDIAHCFDQEPNGPRFPINLVDRLAPALGHDIRGVTRFHTQSCDRARWSSHDRLFDRM